MLTNMYNKMESRHLVGFSLTDFHNRFLYDKKFNRLFKEWVKRGFNKQYKPSLDRINSKVHYTVDNTQMLTWAENRYKQSLDGKRGRKGVVLQMLGDKVIARYASQREAVMKTGIAQGNMSSVLTGQRQTAGGYVWNYEVIGNIYETPELLVK